LIVADDDAFEFGWTSELNMPLAIEAIAGGGLPAFALSSIIDSGPTLRCDDLVPRVESYGAAWWARESGVFVETATLVRLMDDDYFHGFDEIWLFDVLPVSLSVAPPRFSSDTGCLVTEARRDAVAAWMRTAGCLAALGDGIGLNFASFAPSLAAHWREGAVGGE
jgi:hypothetical protein